MAFVMKQQVKSADLKVGLFITKSPEAAVYEVKELGTHVKICKIGESLTLGASNDVFDREIWFLAEDDAPQVMTNKPEETKSEEKKPEEKKEEPKVSTPILIKRKSVVSSNLLSEGYDPTSETLELEFKGGGVYRYSNVPAVIYDRFTKAQSKGNFVHSFIKNKYDCKKTTH